MGQIDTHFGRFGDFWEQMYNVGLINVLLGPVCLIAVYFGCREKSQVAIFDSHFLVLVQ